MQTFLDIALSFPTVVFSVLLMLAVGYWLLTLLGLLDGEVLDLGDFAGDGAEMGGFSGALLKFGLDGLPIALIVTGISLFAWVMSYFAEFLLLRQLDPGLLRTALGVVLMLVLVLIAIPLTGLLLQPLRPLFANLAGPQAPSLLGREAVVRSPKVGPTQGEANLDDGGAGLILKIRSNEEFSRGERVVLVEYLPDHNAYRVIRA